MEKTEKNDSEMRKEIEEFIERVDNKDYVIDKRAAHIRFSDPPKERKEKLLGQRHYVGNLADMIAWVMTTYADPIVRDSFVHECMYWINQAFAWDIVKEGNGLVNKLKKANEKIAKLEKDIVDLSANLLVLKGKYDELSDNVDTEEDFYGKHIKPSKP